MNDRDVSSGRHLVSDQSTRIGDRQAADVPDPAAMGGLDVESQHTQKNEQTPLFTTSFLVSVLVGNGCRRSTGARLDPFIVVILDALLVFPALFLLNN